VEETDQIYAGAEIDSSLEKSLKCRISFIVWRF
jgi:hypothetical protein